VISWERLTLGAFKENFSPDMFFILGMIEPGERLDSSVDVDGGGGWRGEKVLSLVRAGTFIL